MKAELISLNIDEVRDINHREPAIVRTILENEGML